MQATERSSEQDTDSIYFPYDIRFDDSDTSPAVEYLVEQNLRKLARLYDRITDCRVAVRIPHKRATNFFTVHIQLDVPGKRLAVSRDHSAVNTEAAISTAVTDAFHKIVRQLEDHVKPMRERRVEARL